MGADEVSEEVGASGRIFYCQTLKRVFYCQTSKTCGTGNIASGSTSSTVGGGQNTVREYLSNVLGGGFNTANGLGATALGGGENIMRGKSGAVCGGFAIRNTDRYGFAAGGGYTIYAPGPGTFHSPQPSTSLPANDK